MMMLIILRLMASVCIHLNVSGQEKSKANGSKCKILSRMMRENISQSLIKIMVNLRFWYLIRKEMKLICFRLTRNSRLIPSLPQSMGLTNL